MKHSYILLTVLFITASVFSPVSAESILGNNTPDQERQLSLNDFVSRSCESNPGFRKIIIDRLYLEYKDDLDLDIGEIVADFEAGYMYSLDTDKDGFEGGLSVSRLFPQTGTEISALYNTGPGIEDRSSSLTFSISQDIAENSFGKKYKLEKEALGYEKEIIIYQVAEAYEDYLYTLVTLYFDWLSSARAYETAENSYSESKKLLDNVNARKDSSIADHEDVSRSELQLLAKMEDAATAENSYRKNTIQILDAAGLPADSDYYPSEADLYSSVLEKSGLFPGGKNPEDFKIPEKSRTYRILSLNEKLGIKNSEVIKNSLLPDISLFTEISASGTGYNLAEERTRSLSFGISVADFGERRNRKAQLETAEIDIKKIILENSISRKDLDIRLLNYSEDIKNMIRLAEIYERKTVLAEKILKEEQKKYRIGKTDLSSLIDAINTLDLNRRKKA